MIGKFLKKIKLDRLDKIASTTSRIDFAITARVQRSHSFFTRYDYFFVYGVYVGSNMCNFIFLRNDYVCFSFSSFAEIERHLKFGALENENPLNLGVL